jgi:hypothetical protein
MQWVKKNLGFVIGLAVSVVLVGAGIWFLFGTMGDADSVNAELTAKNQQLDELVKRDPFPDQPNIQLAKEEEQRVNSFIAEARKRFGTLQKPEGLDNASFKSLLESTISELIREAAQAGVKIPEKYNFTFEKQRQQLQLPANSLAPLAVQLEDLQALSRVLFEAKVHSLISLKRTPAATNEVGGVGDLLGKKVTSNPIGVSIYPYEIVFQGFDQELAKVLTGLINSPEAFIVKTINVERGSLDSSAPVALPIAVPGGPGGYGADPALARRYGLGNRYAPPTPAPAAPPPTRTGEVVLDEKPLRVTLGVEVVKLAPKPQNAAGSTPAAK